MNKNLFHIDPNLMDNLKKVIVDGRKSKMQDAVSIASDFSAEYVMISTLNVPAALVTLKKLNSQTKICTCIEAYADIETVLSDIKYSTLEGADMVRLVVDFRERCGKGIRKEDRLAELEYIIVEAKKEIRNLCPLMMAVSNFRFNLSEKELAETTEKIINICTEHGVSYLQLDPGKDAPASMDEIREQSFLTMRAELAKSKKRVRIVAGDVRYIEFLGQAVKNCAEYVVGSDAVFEQALQQCLNGNRLERFGRYRSIAEHRYFAMPTETEDMEGFESGLTWLGQELSLNRILLSDDLYIVNMYHECGRPEAMLAVRACEEEHQYRLEAVGIREGVTAQAMDAIRQWADGYKVEVSLCVCDDMQRYYPMDATSIWGKSTEDDSGSLKEREWIPCEKGKYFPKPGEKVQVTYVDMLDKTPHCDGLASRDPEEGWIWDNGESLRDIMVTAWRYMPEPYSVNSSGWTPATKCLPPVGEDLIIFLQDRFGPYTFFGRMEMKDGEPVWINANDNKEFKIGRKICLEDVAWMLAGPPYHNKDDSGVNNRGGNAEAAGSDHDAPVIAWHKGDPPKAGLYTCACEYNSPTESTLKKYIARLVWHNGKWCFPANRIKTEYKGCFVQAWTDHDLFPAEN